MKDIYSVSQLNAYLKSLLSADKLLSDILIQGEISNFKHHASGHMYFTLKDERSVIRCVMFVSSNEALDFSPDEGMLVLAGGYVSLYERDGQTQLYVTDMAEYGTGDLFLQFQKLKKKLAEEGLFDESRKKKLPLLPRAIGVVTSLTGAVLRDMENVLRRRFPGFVMVVYPSRVQGKEAKDEIARGIAYFNAGDEVDVIILARGGGSLEDLWAFNEESLARAIACSRLPVISAVGHETDYTIADFVADCRAPTPSVAAEIVYPEKKILAEHLILQERQMSLAMNRITENMKKHLSELAGRPVFHQPGVYLNVLQMNLDFLGEKFRKTCQDILEKTGKKLQKNMELLEALSPERVLLRGYSITYARGRSIRSMEEIGFGDVLETVFSDGQVTSQVMNKEKRK